MAQHLLQLVIGVVGTVATAALLAFFGLSGGENKGEVKEQKPTPAAQTAARPVEVKAQPGAEKQPDVRPPTFTNSLGMQFVRVPKGVFWMGWSSDKKESRQVTIDRDFELGTYPVTQEEWQALMLDNPSHFSRHGKGKDKVTNVSDADLKRFPVENVSWNDAHEFLKKLNVKEDEKGWLYRLPSEVEWEYACRNAATASEECSFDFFFERGTNDLSSARANFNGQFPAGNAARGPNFGRPTKVGSYAPNKLGLYDMHGKVWQWCDAPWRAGKTSGWAYRGGSWNNQSRDCRAVSRSGAPAANRGNFMGLRLARVPVQ